MDEEQIRAALKYELCIEHIGRQQTYRLNEIIQFKKDGVWVYIIIYTSLETGKRYSRELGNFRKFRLKGV